MVQKTTFSAAPRTPSSSGFGLRGLQPPTWLGGGPEPRALLWVDEPRAINARQAMLRDDRQICDAGARAAALGDDRQICDAGARAAALGTAEHLWTASGPTEDACRLREARGGTMSHGEALMLVCAFDFWNGQGKGELGLRHHRSSVLRQDQIVQTAQMALGRRKPERGLMRPSHCVGKSRACSVPILRLMRTRGA